MEMMMKGETMIATTEDEMIAKRLKERMGCTPKLHYTRVIGNSETTFFACAAGGKSNRRSLGCARDDSRLRDSLGAAKCKLARHTGATAFRHDIFLLKIPTSGMRNARRAVVVCRFSCLSQAVFFSAVYNAVRGIVFSFIFAFLVFCIRPVCAILKFRASLPFSRALSKSVSCTPLM
jgi:hypothetical protein